MLRSRRGNRNLRVPFLTDANTAAPTVAGLPEQPDINDAFRDMRARLRAFIARRVESPHMADDLTQEVLLRLLRSPSSDLADPTAWLYRVARNVIIDHYRTRRPTTPLDNAPHRVPDTATDPFADDPNIARRELAHCLHSMVDRLPEPYRSAVTAVDLDGATHASVAARTGLSVPGVKSRVQRGRRQLRQLLTNCCAVQTAADGGVIDYTAPPTCTSCP